MAKKPEALLVFEDGTAFRGTAFGARGERTGEVVFNTSMTGYQEVLTDPSYKGQIVAMTYPLIGNYGIAPADSESAGIHLEAFVVREVSRVRSNWRSEKSLEEFLLDYDVVGIQGIDTRALTLHIRSEGALKAAVSTEDMDSGSLAAKAQQSPGLVGRDLVKEVTRQNADEWNDPPAPPDAKRLNVVTYDFGVKTNILRMLCEIGCRVTVVPASTSAEDVLALKPDGVMLSNGPGDPEGVEYAAREVGKLIGRVPIFGICLGHQMLGLGLGGRTYKLKFGHHGANHPVMNMDSRKVDITVQNHGFCVDIDSLSSRDVKLTHLNLNDQTPEGMRSDSLRFFSVQYHPEAAPGPHDARHLFDQFVELMTLDT